MAYYSLWCCMASAFCFRRYHFVAGEYGMTTPHEMLELVDELDNWPATERGDGLNAAVVSRLMKRASAIIRQAAAPTGQETVLEQSERLNGTIMQTVRLADGSEVVRTVAAHAWREALEAAKEFADNEFSDAVDLNRKNRILKLCDKIDAALALALPTQEISHEL